MQLMGSRGTSYLVFRKDVWPASHANWVVRSPSKKCSVSDDDESRFFQLWNWGQDRILAQPTIKPDHAWTLADFAAVGGDDNDREEGDLTVMVTTMVKLHDQSTIAPVELLRIWDGTGAPTSEAYPIAVVSSSHNNNNETAPAVDEGDPPPEAMLRLSHVVSELRGRVQQQQNLSIPEAVTGRVANALIWEESHWELFADTVKPGSFVRLRNVKLADLPGSANGQRCLMVYVKTHLTPLPSMTYEVVRLIERHDKRLKRKEPLNPDSGVLPLSWNDGGAHHADPMGGPSTTTVSPHNTNWGTAIVSTLAELVASPGSACFSGVVRISDTVPSIHSASDSALESKLRLANEGIGLRLEQQEQQQGVNEDDSAICFIDVIVGLGSSSAEVLLIALSEKVPFQGKVVSRLRQSIIQKGHWMATVYGIVYEGSRYFQLDKLEALQSYADL
ncbi:hypothetical protein ACA910_011106 [Epithemia clementina (nom. ined.)]